MRHPQSTGRRTADEYWTSSVPVFAIHIMFAVATIGLGAYNLHMGLRGLRHWCVDAMAAGMTLPRRLTHAPVRDFGNTMVTASVVDFLLFAWFEQ